jgi:hypothetical protein
MGRVPYDAERCAKSHHLHYGSGLPVFRGEFRQYGSGLASLLARAARTVLPVLAPIAKSLAKTALNTGGLIMSDVISGKDNFKSSAKKRVSKAITDKLKRKRKHQSDIFDAL